MKLKRAKCYSLMGKSGLSKELILKEYKGYNLIIDNIIFDIFKGPFFTWQINYQGILIEDYDTLKELKENILKSDKFNMILDSIKDNSWQRNETYFNLLKNYN